jgi:MerR family copper efflux transcriptional regulator
MNIGEASAASGVSAKMIRHYESVDLLPRAARASSGYRQYTNNDVHTLRFIRRARDIGFSIEQIRDLLSLWQDRERSNRQVREVAQKHLTELDTKMQEIRAMQAVVSEMLDCCQGDERPDCPILQKLASSDADGEATGATPAGRKGTLREGNR